MSVWKIIKFALWIVVIGALVFAGFKLYGMVEREFFYPLKYEALVREYASKYDLPEGLVYGIIKTESGFDAAATSSAGAVGLMQLMPDTYAWLCGITGEEYDPANLRDPRSNIRYGCLFLSQLFKQFSDTDTVLAAYNAGQGTVIKWLQDESVTQNGKLTNIPYTETREYLKKVKEAANTYERIYANEKEWKVYAR